MRAAPPHSRAVSPPVTVPVRATPRPKAAASPDRDPQHERAIHEADPRVGEQILGVARLVGDLHVGEHPADVGVDETPELTAPSVAVVQMGAVRVALLVGELVMLAVGRHPVDHRSLGRGRAQRGEERPRRAAALEAAVGQQTVESDGDARPDDHVEDRQHEQVLPNEQAVAPPQPHPQQHEDRRRTGDHGAGHAVHQRHLDRAHLTGRFAGRYIGGSSGDARGIRGRGRGNRCRGVGAHGVAADPTRFGGAPRKNDFRWT